MRAPTSVADFRRALTAAALTGALVVAGLGAGPISEALAKPLDEYATWDDVVAAQGDIDRQNQLIDEINVEIDGLDEKVALAEQEAHEKGNAHGAAQQAAYDAAGEHYTLQQQADEAGERANKAEQEVGALSATMSNRASGDPTMELLAQPDQADDFLRSMSTLSKVGTYTGSVYEAAISERDNAEQLTAQAEVALEERQRLEQEAQTAYQEAMDAQARAQQARDEAVDRGAELEAMLIPLKEHRDVVEADYREGERLREIERKRQEEERRRREEQRRREMEEAQRRAAEAAAAAPPAAPPAANGGGGGAPAAPAAPSAPAPAPSGNGGGGSAPVQSGGVASPMSSAWLTTWYGYRINPVFGGYEFHAGIDLVNGVNGGTCGTPLYAITSGTVVFAGWSTGYGLRVDIKSDNGVNTFLYAHIMEGGINVSYGQHVEAGQVIAYTGTTGWSTGCHLHLEVREGWGHVDPQAWLAARGISY